MMLSPVPFSTGSPSISRASQSLMAGVASMYAAEIPRMKPMLRTDRAVFT
ncbi:hypothetical protein STENM36S_03431 [Streptomyces tendae]